MRRVQGEESGDVMGKRKPTNGKPIKLDPKNVRKHPDAGDCDQCGSPYEIEEMYSTLFDEDGEVVEPAVYMRVPQCGCRVASVEPRCDQGH